MLLLSVATTVKVTVCDCEFVVNAIVSSDTVNELIDGSWSSSFVTVMIKLSLSVLPAASLTVAVKFCVTAPKLSCEYSNVFSNVLVLPLVDT